MRIAYVYDAVYPWVKGGIERRIFELSRRFAWRGHEVHCYGMRWWDGMEVLKKDGLYLHGICPPLPLYSGGRRSMREALYFAAKVLSALDGDYDLVDCQEFPYIPCFSAKLRSIAGRSALFITWHEVWGDYWNEYLGRLGILGKAIERATSKLTDKNISVSERTKRDLEAWGVAGVRVIPNGIDFSSIERVKASEEDLDVVYAGRLVKHKNVDLLIRSLEGVKREVPDLRAVIIGDGPEITGLKALARDRGLSGNVEFAGFMDDYDEAIARMKSSKVFVLPSTREGFGMAALEAQACGLPVVTVRHRMNAVCDLVTEKTGLVCQLSEQDLAEAILRGLESANGMREECISLARRYDWEEICQSLEGVYQE
jgi:glycosyltransferase involved in cell wall biosynthesis